MVDERRKYYNKALTQPKLMQFALNLTIKVSVLTFDPF